MAKKLVFFLIFSLTFIFLLQSKPISDMIVNLSNTSNIEENNTIPKLAIKEDWSRIWETGNETRGYGVAVDENTGDVYVTGYNQTEFPFKNHDIILLKYSAAGDLIWNISWDNGAQEFAYDIAVDSEGYVYICGANGTSTLYGDPVSAFDIMLVKFNSSGKFEWINTWHRGVYDESWGLEIDSDNNIYIAGNSVGDLILLKYNSTGHKKGEYIYDEGSTVVGGKDIAIDNSNNLIVIGTNGSFPNPEDIIIIKFNSLCEQIWNTTWVGIDRDQGRGVAIDSNDNIYVTGITKSHGAGEKDIVLIKYDTNGNYQWNRTWGYIYDDESYYGGVAIDTTDSVYVIGSVNFNNIEMALLKYSSSGILLWNKSWHSNPVSTYQDYGNDIYIDLSDNIYTTGFTLLSHGSLFLVKYLPDPSAFEVYSDAGYPDTNGRWTLSWTTSIRADNYSLYLSFGVPITEIDETLQAIEFQTLTSPINILFRTDYNGHYYFIMEAHSEYGNMTSNALHIWVSLIPGDDDDDDDDDDDEEPAIPGYNIWYILGILTAISIALYKKRLDISK